MFSKITTILIATTVVLFAGYIYFVSSLASMSYELEKKEIVLDEQIEKKQEIVLQLASLKTPQYLLVRAGESGLIEIKNFDRFLDTRSSALGRAPASR